MKHYLVIATRRPDFDPAVVAPHLAYLDELHARGLLGSAGGFADGTSGAYVLQGVASLAEAQAIVDADPLALAGNSDLAVHEWKLADRSGR
ncbi:YciI family protein [Pseudoxanthomonas sp. J35]|uniref:YciI family protein n=1 Tax=Pseudoxanthomonas sp. J35 TaxID=935852 RepID=UPI0004900E2A|nr:YciI family protein [Pseudoxanthomonas sp. J35]